MLRLDLKQLITVLIIILLAMPLLVGLLNRQHHLSWRAAAVARGWRYRLLPWWQRWQRQYRLAGSTAHGAIWELQRQQRDGVFLYRWVSEERPLRYGSLYLIPQRQAAAVANQPDLQPVAVGDRRWQTTFLVLATHQQLGSRHITPEIQQLLQSWPTWPAQGSLELLRWDAHALVIQCRFHRDWETIDRIVALGTALLNNNHREERKRPL